VNKYCLFKGENSPGGLKKDHEIDEKQLVKELHKLQAGHNIKKVNRTSSFVGSY